MKVYRISRNGEVKATVPAVIHADGTLWVSNKVPMMDSGSAAFKAMGKEKVAAFLKAGNYDAIPTECYVREGHSETGLTIESMDEINARETAEYEANMTPAQKARRDVDALFAKAERAEHAKYYDPQTIICARADAEDALKVWREKYPAEAKEERRAYLIARAEREEELAAGALTYDCDGSFNEEYRQKRHDEFMAKAGALRIQARDL